jgi:Zn-dependent protease with chaperone function
MRKRMHWIGPIWAFTFFLLLPRATSGQRRPAASQDSQEEDRERQEPFASLAVNLSEGDRADVNFFTTLESSHQAESLAAVEKALGCKLQLNSRLFHTSTFLNGSCRLALTAATLQRRGRIWVAPLAAFARSNNLERIDISLRVPESETFDARPAPTPPLAEDVGTPFKRSRHLDRAHSYSWSLDSNFPEEIAFSFGYSEVSARRAAAILVLVLVAPVLFVIWLGRRALSAPAADKAAVWFSYMRYLQWTATTALVGWWIASETIHLVPVLKFLSTGWLATAWRFPVTAVIVDWVPPCLLWILCFALSHPVQEKLRGLKWTRRELVLQGVYSVCAALIPMALFLTGLQTLGIAGFRKAMLWFVAAFVVRLLAAGALQKLMGTQPQALTTGDLRDHAFGMAERLGVKVQQVYVVPAGKGRIANAFARSGNTIAFTDFLLQRMSRAEVNYVLGHELTHLKHKHPGKIAAARVASMFGAFFVVGLAMPFGLESPILRYGTILAIVTLFPLLWSRRFEYAADAGAVELTGDPRSAISALFKLSSLNMMPLHWSKWSEKWLTHPSSLRRAQAIARKAGIPVEQIQEIASSSIAQTDHYILPPTVAPGAKVLSTQKKLKSNVRATFAMLLAIMVVPAAFALMARYFAGDPVLHRTLYLVGPLAAFFAYLAFANFAALTGLPAVIRSLKDKLKKEGVETDAWGGIIVGFAPAASPRIYELNTNWDIGCLFIRSDRLCYFGEETRFVLCRSEITAITLGPGLPALVTNRRIYIAWKDPEQQRSGAFNVGCIEGSSLLEVKRKTTRLEKMLQDWRKASADARPVPAQLGELRSPVIGAVTGVAPNAHWKIGRVFKELFLTGVLATIVAVLCGLPFHLLAYLVMLPLPTTERLIQIHSPGAGWYVVCVAVVLRAIGLVPSFTYKDKHYVEVASSAGETAGVPPPPRPTQPRNSKAGIVLTR